MEYEEHETERVPGFESFSFKKINERKAYYKPNLESLSSNAILLDVLRDKAGSLGTKRKRPREPRVVVAVLGGATYSELRAAYEVSRDTHREVIMGGSALLAPGGFLASLAD